MHATSHLRLMLASLAVCLCLSTAPRAEVRLPRLFGDHMVLQRERPIPVWGWAEPGETVRVELVQTGSTHADVLEPGHVYVDLGAVEARSRSNLSVGLVLPSAGRLQAETTADDTGRWRVDLGSVDHAFGRWRLDVQGASSAVAVEDVLIGEVWLTSGQSNMDWLLSSTLDAVQEAASADYPLIRMINVPDQTTTVPAADVAANWQVVSPANAYNLSAVSYFFAREIHRELDVPVGILWSAVGGSLCEKWLTPEYMARDEITSPILNFTDRMPGGHFFPMIHPLIPYGIRGALWYQGESNIGRGWQYRVLFPALVDCWRDLWQQGDFPFYFVQLAPYRYDQNPSLFAELTEAQFLTLQMPNTGMAVINDIGNVNDIHPRNKKDVGKRLALWALAKDYGYADIVYSGPLYRDMEIEGDRIRIHFDHVGSGLTTRDGEPPNWFTIAGEDQEFLDAEAAIDGDTVVVHSPGIAEPVAVRFAWHQEAQPNLMNQESLPASSFRTDDWPMLSEGVY